MLTAEMRNFVDQLRDYTNQAQVHLTAAGVAHDAGKDRDLRSAHSALNGVLRGMHRTFDSIGKAGAAADSDNNKIIQTSSGTGKSDGTANGRTAAPVRNTPGLLTNDPKTFLDRARQGSRR
jgi:hypothetical protein